jgi:hypothetical protein
MATPLYIHVKKGTQFKPGSLVPEHAVKADYVLHPVANGDSVGVLWAKTYKARQILEAIDGVTVAPPMHRPLTADHIKKFAHCGVTVGDTTFELAEKLFTFHGMLWFHPEEQDIF